MSLSDGLETMTGKGVSAALAEHADYIDRMLETVPAKYYFAVEVDEENFEWKGKYKHNPSEKMKKKQLSKELSKKGKQAKLDPSNEKTVVELQYERKLADIDGKGDDQDSSIGDDPEQVVDVGFGENDGDGAEESGSDDSDEEESEGDNDEGDDGARASTKRQRKNSTGSDRSGGSKSGAGGMGRPLLKPTAPASSLDELRSRLRDRVEHLRQKRKAKEIAEDEKKEKRQVKKQTKKAKREKAKDNPGRDAAPVSTGSSKRKREEDSNDIVGNGEVVEDVAFGNLKFASKTDSVVAPHKKKKKAKTSELLKKAEKMEEKMRQDSTLKEAVAWSNLEKKAKGVKVKDDKKLLKKTLKRETKQKEKSRKAWAERKEAEDKRKQEKQDKRKENLKKRADRKKGGNKKSGSGSGKKGKGGTRAGFEGKKGSKFINK